MSDAMAAVLFVGGPTILAIALGGLYSPPVRSAPQAPPAPPAAVPLGVEYPARLVRIKDGDTAVFEIETLYIDRDHYSFQAWPVRFRNLNTSDVDKAPAREALRGLLASAAGIYVRPEDGVNFERAEAVVTVETADGERIDVASWMKERGFDVPRGK